MSEERSEQGNDLQIELAAALTREIVPDTLGSICGMVRAPETGTDGVANSKGMNDILRPERHGMDSRGTL
jgi:hypothetical protein